MRATTFPTGLTLILSIGLGAGCANFEAERTDADQETEPDPVVHEVGATGPAGGFIVLDKGAPSDGWRYLEAAPVGWPGQAEDPVAVWGGTGTLVDGTEGEVGTGAANTARIVTAYGENEPDTNRPDYAARMCAEAVINDFDDWFLPSINEMLAMYENLHRRGIGGLEPTSYWTSTERTDTRAMVAGIGTGGQISGSKVHEYRVRPVRTF
jgi:hypothetical protein